MENMEADECSPTSTAAVCPQSVNLPGASSSSVSRSDLDSATHSVVEVIESMVALATSSVATPSSVSTSPVSATSSVVSTPTIPVVAPTSSVVPSSSASSMIGQPSPVRATTAPHTAVLTPKSAVLTPKSAVVAQKSPVIAPTSTALKVGGVITDKRREAVTKMLSTDNTIQLALEQAAQQMFNKSKVNTNIQSPAGKLLVASIQQALTKAVISKCTDQPEIVQNPSKPLSIIINANSLNGNMQDRTNTKQGPSQPVTVSSLSAKTEQTTKSNAITDKKKNSSLKRSKDDDQQPAIATRTPTAPGSKSETQVPYVPRMKGSITSKAMGAVKQCLVCRACFTGKARTWKRSVLADLLQLLGIPDFDLDAAMRDFDVYLCRACETVSEQLTRLHQICKSNLQCMSDATGKARGSLFTKKSMDPPAVNPTPGTITSLPTQTTPPATKKRKLDDVKTLKQLPTQLPWLQKTPPAWSGGGETKSDATDVVPSKPKTGNIYKDHHFFALQNGDRVLKTTECQRLYDIIAAPKLPQTRARDVVQKILSIPIMSEAFHIEYLCRLEGTMEQMGMVKQPSVLRCVNKGVMNPSFTMETLLSEMDERCPRVLQILLTLCCPIHKNLADNNYVVPAMYAMAMNCRSVSCSTFQKVMAATCMKHSGVELVSLLRHLQLTASNDMYRSKGALPPSYMSLSEIMPGKTENDSADDEVLEVHPSSQEEPTSGRTPPDKHVQVALPSPRQEKRVWKKDPPNWEQIDCPDDFVSDNWVILPELVERRRRKGRGGAMTLKKEPWCDVSAVM